MSKVIENEIGGKQSEIGFSVRDYLSKSLPRLAQVEYEGSINYGRDNWSKIPINDNLEHAIRHILMYLNNDGEECDHLAHAGCRIAMAMANQELERLKGE